MEDIEKATAESVAPDAASFAFTYSNAGDGMYKAADAGQRGGRLNGVPVAVPHMPYIMAVDPSGNVCNVTVSTNRLKVDRDHRCESVRIQSLKAGGWLIVDDEDLDKDHKTGVVKIKNPKILQAIADRRNASQAAAMQIQSETKAEVDRMVKVFKAAVGAAGGKRTKGDDV